MPVTYMLIATNVSLPKKETLSADGALVILLTTRVLVRLHSNAVVSKPVSHSTSPAQLISEPLTARVTLVMLEPKNAASVMMVNSHPSQLAQKFAKKMSHMPNATQKPKSAILNANMENQAATTETTVIPLVMDNTQNATLPLANVLTVILVPIQTAYN